MEDLEDKTYIIFAQANVWKSPNASNELGYYINKLMSCYKYDGPDQAGLMVNRMPEKDTNYINRLSNLGIRINDSEVVISRPSAADREKYRASYRREQAKIATVCPKELDTTMLIQIRILLQPRQNLYLLISVKTALANH